MAIRKESGPTRLLRRLLEARQRAGVPVAQVRLSGATNNCDHQARICHSTTVAGVANTWGYGAMTNSSTTSTLEGAALPRLQRGRGAPVSMLHTCTPRSTAPRSSSSIRGSRARGEGDYSTASAPDDIPFIYGMLHTSSPTAGRTRNTSPARLGMDKAGRSEEVDAAGGEGRHPAWRRRGAHLRRDHGKEPAQHHHLGDGQTQHTNGNAWCVRAASSSSRSATSGVRRRHQHLPRHDNVQARPTSAQCRLAARLLRSTPAAWQHWARVWNIDSTG